MSLTQIAWVFNTSNHFFLAPPTDFDGSVTFLALEFSWKGTTFAPSGQDITVQVYAGMDSVDVLGDTSGIPIVDIWGTVSGAPLNSSQSTVYSYEMQANCPLLFGYGITPGSTRQLSSIGQGSFYPYAITPGYGMGVRCVATQTDGTDRSGDVVMLGSFIEE